MDIIKFCIVMLAAASFRMGVNTELIPYEDQKNYIEEYVFEIIEEGNYYNVPPSLVLAVVEKESTYYWQARNGEHYGLMQINPKWHKDRMEKLGVEDLAANPYNNLLVGIDYISELLKKYEDSYDALNVYNSGSTNGIAGQYALSVMSKKYEIDEYLWDKYEGW